VCALLTGSFLTLAKPPSQYNDPVADLIAGREPLGGKQSVKTLRDSIAKMLLNGQQLRRYRETDRKLREKSAAPKTLTQTVTGEKLDVNVGLNLDLDASMPTSVPIVTDNQTAMANLELTDGETFTFRALSHAAWCVDFREQLQSQNKRFRLEPNRPSLRLIYATLHNLEQYSELPGFSQDLNLAKFKVISAVPNSDDPLISLGNSDVVNELLEGLANHITNFPLLYPKLSMPSSETLGYLRRFAVAVANDSTAGEPPPVVSPSPREIQNALEEVRRENLNPEAKRNLLERLQKQLDHALLQERTLLGRYESDRRALQDAVETIFGYLIDQVPERLGGRAKDRHPLQKALNAQNENLRLEQVSPNATEVAVRLQRTGGTTLGGIEIHWHTQPEGWAIEVGGAEYPLQSDMSIPLEGQEIRVYTKQALGAIYAFIQIRDRGGASTLWEALKLARTVAVMLDPGEQYLNLRLARAATSWIKDRRVDLEQVSPEIAANWANAPEDRLLDFARKGATRLQDMFKRSPEAVLERAFFASAESLAEPGGTNSAQVVTKAFRELLKMPDHEPIEGFDIKKPDEALLILYRGEPITIRVMQRALTIRTDNLGKVYVLLPGGGGRTLEQILVHHIPSGAIIMAREGLRIALSYIAI
jgi:hypothetical protein